MSDIPRAPEFDSSIAFLREGYTFVGNRCDRLGSDLFSTRIMLTPVICMRGAEAAGMFYEGDRFSRQGAMPRTVLYLLQDQGSVQTLDGDEHKHRKRMFLDILSPASVDGLVALVREELLKALPDWSRRDRIVLLKVAQGVLARAAARWAGTPFADEDEARARTREFAAMVEQAGSIGPGNWYAQLLRQRTEKWAKAQIEAIRSGALPISENAPAALLAHHRDPAGRLLSLDIAAVELLNLLRPIVAVANFITFAGLALHEHPEWAARFASGDEADLRPFAQEVRRHYPFFPLVGGRVREPFNWRGFEFEKQQWVLLDLYGTNHDARLWPEPNQFRPERFRNWNDEPNTFIPQGAGHVETGHRCPGEEITVQTTMEFVRFLTQDMRYRIPPQDLRFSLSELPALPKSRIVITEVRAA